VLSCVDVESIYHAVLKQVTKLNDVRSDSGPSTSSTDEANQPNRVDQTLTDVFSLVSLFFLTIGKARTSVAGFCQIASMRVRPFLAFVCLFRLIAY
jgi:hypothetical protein